MKRWLGLILIVILSNIEVHSQSSELLGLIKNETHGMPDGTEFSMGIFKNGEWSKFGFRIENGELVSRENFDMLFEIGSITKTFTATLIMTLVKEGQLKLNDPISHHLPIKMAEDSFQNKTITIKHLITHTSGLSPGPSTFTLPYIRALIFSPKNPNRNFKARHYYKYLRNFELDYLPGREWNYNNAGYGLLGEVVKFESNLSWSEYLEKEILSPLNMRSTCVRINKSNQHKLVPGITSKGKKAKPWEMDFIDPAGAIKSTLDDMILYVNAQMYSSDSTYRMAQEDLDFEIEMPKGLWKGNAMGLGWWYNLENEERPFTWHGGASGGYTSIVAFSQESKEAVIILSNVSSSHPQSRAENRVPKIMFLGHKIMRGERGV